MPSFLFYKTKPIDGGTEVEFRRVENGQVTTFLPEKLRGTVTVPPTTNLDKAVQLLVQQTGWVGPSPRLVGDELSAVVLKGRW